MGGGVGIAPLIFVLDTRPPERTRSPLRIRDRVLRNCSEVKKWLRQTALRIWPVKRGVLRVIRV